MATILNGDIGVEYLSNNRQKRLYWIGGTNTSYTMNEVYSAAATLLDEATTIDDGTIFSAETPVEYTIGKIDTGDVEPWYITFDLMEKITGGALRTSGWQRVQDSNTGVVVVGVASGGTIAKADEGFDMTHGDGDVGTLLEFIDTGGSTDYLVIRPDSSAIGNSFDNTTGTITSSRGAFTATQNAAATTGEMIWANLYSIGTIDPNVHLYIYQGLAATDGNRVRLTSWNDNTQDWYGNGQIDITVALKDITATTWSVIDSGYLTVYARKYGDVYSHFEVATSTTSGGRNPIPLQTANDIDNPTGILIETFDGTNFTSGWNVGDIMSGDTSGARGIITAITSPGASQVVEFIPIDDPLGVSANWTSGENVTSTGGGTGSFTDLPSDTGPALSTWFTNNTPPTVTFTHTTSDVDDDATNENYGITINCQQNPLSEVYEWQKYATRNGETTNDLDGINGESYIGATVYIKFSSETTAIGEGEDVTQEGTGATGVVIAYNTANSVMLLRSTRGTFTTGGATDRTITSNDSAGAVEMDSGTAVVNTFAPSAASPLGTFAGGTAFAARGVLYTNYLAADENSFILTPMEGGTKQRPQSISLEVSNLVGGAQTSNEHDRVGLFRRTGASGGINKEEYACVGGEAIGANTITVTTSIAQDVPGKTAGGVLILVDSSDGGAEYRMRYSSWTGSVFTLAEVAGTATGGTTTTLVDSGASFNTTVKRGDVVTVTGKGTSHVKTVDSATQITIEGTFSTAPTTDAYEFNTPPVAITSSDFVYVPFIDKVAEAATESVSIIYNSQIFYRGKVRNTRNTTTKIKPFSVDGSTSGSDVSIATIRTADTIIT